MIVEIQHETRLSYSEPVTEAVTEVRMEPVSDGDQSCHSFHLLVSPMTEIFNYQDGFRNRVHHFTLLPAHEEVRVLAAHVVETHPQTRDLLGSLARFPLELDGTDLEPLHFLQFGGPVRQTPLLTPVLEALRPTAGKPLGELIMEVAQYICGHYEYARDVTQASSPIDDLLQHGKGVCQDFAHLMIAVLRSFCVPARYVSGYIHRPNKDSQSHAWCEAWLPDRGWVGVDPTNNRVVDEHFIKVAIGRDFTDTPPNKGVYRGKALETIFVRVETRELVHLPSLSWRDHLPKLDVPLTAITSRAHGSARSLVESQQQQQQQQQQQ